MVVVENVRDVFGDASLEIWSIFENLHDTVETYMMH